jgi:hypothetical protein
VGKFCFSLAANCNNDTSLELLLSFSLSLWVGVLVGDHAPTAVFVEHMDNLFDSFNSVKRGAPCKPLRSPFSDSIPHIGHWTKAGMEIKSWIFLRDGKPAFRKPTPSQNGWIVDIGIVQHLWKRLKIAGFNYLKTRSPNHMRPHLVLFVCTVVQTVTQL